MAATEYMLCMFYPFCNRRHAVSVFFFFFSFSVLELKLKESELGNLDIEHASPKREWLEVLASRMP